MTPTPHFTPGTSATVFPTSISNKPATVSTVIKKKLDRLVKHVSGARSNLSGEDPVPEIEEYTKKVDALSKVILTLSLHYAAMDAEEKHKVVLYINDAAQRLGALMPDAEGGKTYNWQMRTHKRTLVQWGIRRRTRVGRSTDGCCLGRAGWCRARTGNQICCGCCEARRLGESRHQSEIRRSTVRIKILCPDKR